jgi:hypothetical protein
VTEAPVTPPIIAPATAPVSPSPDNTTLSIDTTVAKITVCIFWADDRSTTSGLKELYEHPAKKIIEIIRVLK